MVIDPSAFVTIVAGASKRASSSQAIVSQPIQLASAATLLETTMVVLGRKGEPGVTELGAFIGQTGIETAPFSAEQLDLAVDAFRHFGKGRHPAGLNAGDCFTYALANATVEPLLLKGDGFSVTDIRQAV